MCAYFQNLTVGALNSRSALSVLVGALFKKFRSLFEPASYTTITLINVAKPASSIDCTAFVRSVFTDNVVSM
jgi:hypothetical protein